MPSSKSVISTRPAWRGFHLYLAEDINEADNRSIHALATALLDKPLPGVTDIIPSYTTLYLEYDANIVQENVVRGWCEAVQTEITSSASGDVTARKTVPVHYDGEDLAEISQRVGLTVQQVIDHHTQPDYHVFALGFTPGFAFMGNVPEAIHTPRRSSPRVRIPAHSVAMTGGQTGVYPSASPGGWNLLGRALVAMYDPQRKPPFWLEPGDRVRFEAREGKPPADVHPLDLLPDNPEMPVLEVVKPGLLDIVVDGGRTMAGRYGLCRGGMLDVVSGTLANRLVGNAPFAPMLELNVVGGRYRALTPCVIGLAGTGMLAYKNEEVLDPPCSIQLQLDDELSFTPSYVGVRMYMAVAGGIDSKQFMGSSSVDLNGNIGKPLTAGVVLGQQKQRDVHVASFPNFQAHQFGETVSLRLLPGPQASDEALSALTRQVFSINQADRMGLRLASSSGDVSDVPGGELTSEAVPIGAVQVPPGAAPIVLLHDRGSIGGYHKPAVIHPYDLHRAAQLRQGQKLRFCLVDDTTSS